MIAYGFIAEIDDFFAQSLKDSKLKGEAQEETFQVQPDEETLTRMKETPLKFVYMSIKIFYQCFYYYFLPFISLAFFSYQIASNSE